MKTYTVYKTTNLINGRWYIGVHKRRYKKDSYIGSGDLIREAIKKYGKSNFVNEILFTYDTATEAYDKERELVTEDVIKDKMSYNIKLGGEGGWERHNNTNKVIVKDADGNKLKVDKDDPRYISGELVSWNKGITQNKDTNAKRSAALKGIEHERYVCECGASVARQSSAMNRHNTSYAHANNMTGISLKEWQKQRDL